MKSSINITSLLRESRTRDSFFVISFTTIPKNNYSTSREPDSNVSDTDMSDSPISDSGDESRVDPQDGSDVDATKDIVKYCKSANEVENYFTTKENSIRSSYRSDSNSAAADGVSASELSDWQEYRDYLLHSLLSQKNHVYDLGDYSDEENSTTSNNEENVSNNTPENANNSNREENNSSNSFPQDSSDVTQTEFDPSDHYDDF